MKRTCKDGADCAQPRNPLKRIKEPPRSVLYWEGRYKHIFQLRKWDFSSLCIAVFRRRTLSEGPDALSAHRSELLSGLGRLVVSDVGVAIATSLSERTLIWSPNTERTPKRQKKILVFRIIFWDTSTSLIRTVLGSSQEQTAWDIRQQRTAKTPACKF